MKRLLSIGLVPVMLLIYWLTAVQRFPDCGAIFIPCSPETMYSYRILGVLNVLMYTLLYPIKFLFFSRLGLSCFFFFEETLISYREEHQLLGQLVFWGEVAIPFAVIGVTAAFLYLLRKTDSSFWFLLPFYISIGHGLFMTLAFLDEGIGALIIFLFFIVFGMFWAVVSHFVYWFLGRFARK